MIKNSEYLSPNHRKLRVGELIKQNLGQIFLTRRCATTPFTESPTILC